MMSMVVARMRSALAVGCLAAAASGSCGGETDAPGGNSETNFGRCATDGDCDPGERCVAQECESTSGAGADAEPVESTADAESAQGVEEAGSREGSSDGTPPTRGSCETRSLADCESEPLCHLIYLRPIDVENGCLGAPAPVFCKERFEQCAAGPLGCQLDGDGGTWFGAPCGEHIQQALPGHACATLLDPLIDGGSETVSLPRCEGVSPEPYAICASMLQEATQAMNSVLEAAPGCAIDEDCMKLDMSFDCADFCIAFPEASYDALVDPISLAASECTGYAIAGCEPADTPCDVQTPARCIEGRCEP